LNIDIGRLSTIFDSETSSNSIRLQVWEVALERIRANPWTGLGQSGFTAYYLEHRPLNASSQWIGHTHNLFLQLWVEGGNWVLVGFLVLWGAVVRQLWRRKVWGAAAVLLAGLLLNLVDYTWFYAGVHYGLWVAIAYALNFSEKPPATSRIEA
jgi:O-antigen ligase